MPVHIRYARGVRGLIVVVAVLRDHRLHAGAAPPAGRPDQLLGHQQRSDLLMRTIALALAALTLACGKPSSTSQLPMPPADAGASAAAPADAAAAAAAPADAAPAPPPPAKPD